MCTNVLLPGLRTVSIIAVPLTIWNYTYLYPYTAQSSPITRVSVTCRAEEKTETIFSLHQIRFFSLKYWQFHIYRKLWKSDPLLAESFTAMDLSADSPVRYCFSPNADGGLLCGSHCGHILIQKQMLKLACPDFSYRNHHCYTAVAAPTDF